ncbi:hypothetical protein [Cellulomonas sp. S1-8]|uniref:hypothetical protein n=1 Tax=Cellulomonas sp. S1-8 TaxID=2904790 RepID=UPI00224454AC|nr:hypothetical protein [Cellulomonas sp. S1-8]UZN02117.1 hypothetical protein OKX07_13605 [Cellulomonas sp. S1-8]
MSTPARTPAAGLPGPVWPARPVPPTVRTPGERVASPAAPQVRPAPLAHRSAAPAAPPAPPAAGAPAAPVVPPSAPGALSAPVALSAPRSPDDAITAEERALDPRSIARASLAAGRNTSLWWTLTGIGAAVGAAFVADAVVGAMALAALLLVYAVVRAVGRPPGPVAVAVRSKPLDVTVLVGAAITLVVLASVLPAG